MVKIAMTYTVVDLLDKFISIEQAGYELYMKIASETDVTEKIKVLARVFALEEKRHIDVFSNMKDKVKDDSGIVIDFSIYDRASQLISEFIKFTRNLLIKDTRELIEFCLNFEEENLALLVIIQGILIQSQEDEKTTKYKVLTELIKEEQNHIRDISIFKK